MTYMAIRIRLNRLINFILGALLIFSLSTTLSTYAATLSTLPGLSVSGIEIVANGQPVRLHGVNMGDPFWARNPDWYPEYSLADYGTLSEDWRANVVRISVFPTQWKNMDHSVLLDGLGEQINAAFDNNMYVIISYHVIGWPDGYYQPAYSGNPADTYDSSMSVATSFWAAVTQTYGSDTRIIFDLWNEPVHPDDFTLYGSDPNPLWPDLKGYYESLIQTVRDNDGQNIIIATGNRWASWLVGIKDDPLTDPDVIYAYHKYSVNELNTPGEWDKDTGGLIGIKPVIVSEWGYEDTDAGANPTWPGSQASYGDPFTKWMDTHNLSNLAWMYHHDWTPALLKSDGSLTLYGNFVKNYISNLASVRFAVIGDYGFAGQPELDVANLIKSWTPDFVITLGDNNYPSGSAATIDPNIGQYYHEFIYPYAGAYGTGATVNQFFPSLGNHDWDTMNAQPFLNYFTLPGNERYYDYVQGPVHFFVIDSDSREPDGITSTSTQALWLKNKLAASTSSWNVVYMHVSPYSSSQHGSTPELQWPFAIWGADVVLSGHDHVYERIYYGGVLYLVNGLGGMSPYTFGIPVSGSQFRYSSDYGALLVDATSEEIQFQFTSRTGAVIDTYSLAKSTPQIAPALLDPDKLSFHEVASGLNKPVLITNAGDGSGRLFVVERPGRIRIQKNGVVFTTPFLDIQSSVKSTNSEQGLLALAFHPNYESNGKFYVAYTAPRNGDTNGSILTLRQYTVSAGNSDLANPNSGITILTIDHPSQSNHNGGTLVFGDDGYLYWSTGDGGGGGDPNNNGQNLSSHLGKILRIDVNSGSPYSVPTSNPFYNDADPSVKKEIWAYGLRNPWRISFDQLTHDLYVGDVGQSNREEIDYQPANSSGGENYGWNIMEGSTCYNASTCDQNNKILPVAEYTHSLGCSVTGGHVYRGPSYPSLSGYYFYGDYCSGRIFSIYNNLPSGWSAPVQLSDTPYFISTFGEDENGELYLADYNAGKIYRIQYAEPSFSIAGNAGIGGATLSYVNGTVKTMAADGSGNYSITVPADWSGIVIPYKTGYTFTPVSRTYTNLQSNQTSQNYAAEACVDCPDVSVQIGESPMGNYTLAAGESVIPFYNGVADGPVLVESTNGENILTSEHRNYQTSFSETLGYPDDQLTTEYWFTRYAYNANVKTWLLIANPANADADVEIYIGDLTTPVDSFSLTQGSAVSKFYDGLAAGPVLVKSTNGVNILASEHRNYQTSFSETLGYPDDQLTTAYWFTRYAYNANVKTWLLVINPSNTDADVEICIGDLTTPYDSFSLAAGATLSKYYDGLVDGPVLVKSTNGVNILASEHRNYQTSFSETLGYPANQLTTEYWFTRYAYNANVKTWLLIANPDPSQTAEVSVYIGSDPDPIASYSIPASATVTPFYDGVANGPVRVVSTNGVDILASEHRNYQTSFSETLGYPEYQLTTKYWFTRYAYNANVKTWLLIANP